MKKWEKRYGIIRILFVLIVLIFCSNIPVFAQNSDQQVLENNSDILFISSYSYSWPTVPLQIAGIESALDDTMTLEVEFMDTKVLSQEIAEKELLERIRYKKKTMGDFDAVIVGDDAALRFAMKYREELFSGIPIVFEGINNIDYAEEVSEDPLVSGVIERFSYKDNLDFAKKIQPKADKIVAIVDNTVTGIGEQKQFFSQAENYPELSFDVINSSLLTKEQIIEKISEIDETTILIYLILSEDTEGNIYTNEQCCHMLKTYANVPVLRFVQAGIGEGVLGGNIVLHQESGKIAAKMTTQMLHSSDPSDIKMQKESPNGFYLDQNVLDRFHISQSLIPDGAEIINETPGFWEMYGKILTITLFVLAFMLMLIILLMHMLYEQKRSVELEKKNEELSSAILVSQEATKAKSDFLHSMSHDIRTPMNAIIGFTNIAMKQNSDERVGECLKKISASSDHLLTLINDVLDIGRIESGKVLFNPIPSNLCSLTEEVVAITQGFLADRDLTFRVERPEQREHCSVLTDPTRICEVLVNILSNAVKFTEDGGTIVFSMGSHPGEDEKHMVVWFEVSDTGCGMSEEFLSHVFDEFSQENSGARTQYKGTGLGMAITKHYVEMMNGKISVKSKKGEGTIFRIELPMELTDTYSVIKQEEHSDKNILNGLHVLMAEDNDLNAEIAMVQLEEYGMQITRAVDGKDVLEIFRSHPAGTYDIILMDIMMPVINGYEATKILRSMEDRPDGKTIPIVAMTANAFMEDVKTSMDVGMNAHLPKPIVMEDVLKTIIRVLPQGKKSE